MFSMHYVYVLFSEEDKQLYTGSTDDLRSRLKAHSGGFVRATKYRRPLKLIYYEAYLKKSDAKRREKYLKGGNGRGELKKQLEDILIAEGYRHLE